MRHLSIIALSLITGCSTLAKPEAFAACQAADTITTIKVLHAGGVEKNPLMGGIIKSAGYVGMIAFKLFLVWLVFHFQDDIAPEVIAAGTMATCAVAGHNALQ